MKCKKCFREWHTHYVKKDLCRLCDKDNLTPNKDAIKINKKIDNLNNSYAKTLNKFFSQF